MGYTVKLSKNHDEKKPTLIFGDLVYRVNQKNLFATRFIMNTAKILSKDFNIFFFSVSNNVKAAKEVMDQYNTISYVFLDDKELTFLRKKEDPDYTAKNRKTSFAMIERDLTMIKNVKGVFLRPTVLFKSDMENELYDCISEDSEKLKISNEEVKRMNDMIIAGKMYAYTMFMSKATRIVFDVFEYFAERDKAQVYQFLIDPAHYYKYFNTIHGAKTYYFEDDFRGNRELNQYPMGQLNHFFNAEKVEVPSFEDKKNLFMWGGVILFPKGERMDDWHRLLKDFNLERSVLHVAKGNAMKQEKKPRLPRKLLEHPMFESTNSSIENHPLNEGILPNEEFEDKLKDYRYTLILKCLSESDSLNFRIYYSLLYNIIPFIDESYDPDCLQIPKRFRDKLVVSNQKDIEEKILYFENNLEDAKKLLKELQNYYMDDKFYKEEYYYNQFKNNYFKEIY